ncbi:MAG: c-type cytochrome [Verrucomicrobia bacterium]|nr:c-type cytochrome [Verrucomicrobiota bacterium]
MLFRRPTHLLALTLLCARLGAQDAAHDHGGGAQIEKPVVFLDKPAVIINYQLARLSNVQLLMVDRQPTEAKYAPVYQAILERAKMNAKDREEAVDALVKIGKSNRVTELLASIEKLDAKEDNAVNAVLTDLAGLLMKSDAASFRAKRAALDALLGQAKRPATKQAAAAGLILAAGSAEAVWAGVAKDNAALAAIVAGLPLVPDAALRAQFQPKLAPLVKTAPTPALLRAVIAALPAMKGNEKENFVALAGLIQQGKERTAAVHAMAKLPRDAWDKDLAGPVARSLVDHAGKVPQAKRTEQDFLDVAALANDLSMLLPADLGKALRKALGALSVRVIVVKTLHEQMFFDKTQFVVEAGRPVEIHFQNTDVMPHNFVITQPGALDEIGAAAEKMPPVPDAKGRHYVPDSAKIFQATKLINPDDNAKLAFTAPKKAESYPYVCTFPGHWQRMRGVMIVVDDLEDYLAKNPNQPAAPVITEWKMETLAPALAKLGADRNFAKGRELFTSVGCIACHKVGTDGLLYGPELTQVLAKYKNDPKAVLEQILEPSKTIEPRYRTYSITVGNDEPISGFILKEDADSLTVQTGPAETLITKFAKKDVKARDPQQLSLMPGGLLNLLNEEQILDLLAFVTCGGDPKCGSFGK